MLGYTNEGGLTVELRTNGNPASKTSLEKLCQRARGDILKVRYPCPQCGAKKLVTVKCPPKDASSENAQTGNGRGEPC